MNRENGRDRYGNKLQHVRHWMPSGFSQGIRLVFVTVFVAAAAHACRQDIGLLLRDQRLQSSGAVSAPAVLLALPGDEVDAVGTNARISILFSTGMASETITTNTTGTTCSGTVQVSADNFVSCVQMAAQPVAADANRVFTLTPAATLATQTVYKIKITTAARAADQGNLRDQFTTAVGFRTGPGSDTRAPIGPQAAGFIVPYDAAASVGVNTKLLVYFLEAVPPSAMIVNTTNNQCSGSVRLSKDNFTTCVPFQDRPVVSANGKVYTFTPSAQLDASTAYKIGIQAGITDLAGNAFAGFTSNFTTAAGVSPTPSSVAGTSPADGVGSVSINASYQITFNRSIDPATLNLNFQSPDCTGVIQVSANGFSTCVPFSPRVLLSESLTDVYLYPLASLATSTNYRIRVTADLKDAFGVSVTAFAHTTGFTTGNPVSPVVEHLIAFDGSSLGNLLAPFGVSFSKIMNPATITVNTSNTSCVGGYSFQVSSDNFSTCLRMTGVVANSSNSRFFAYPALPLSPNTVYKTRLTIGAQDSGGLANTLYTGTGITTEP